MQKNSGFLSTFSSKTNTILESAGAISISLHPQSIPHYCDFQNTGYIVGEAPEQLTAMANSEELDPNFPPGLHLVSAFLAMEPSDSLISIARACGGGIVSENVQRFIWEQCINQAAAIGYAPYVRNFVKKLIFEVESTHGCVLDELYENYGYYMTSLKEDSLGRGKACKHISFLFTDGSLELSNCPKSRKFVVPLNCSLNMLEGDTGCSVWPSSLYLSEFILSFPDRFSNKTCFEVGSGVGLVGICLSHVKASKVVLSDGDLSTFANMKLNLGLNHISTRMDVLEKSDKELNLVKSDIGSNSEVQCIHLSWESAAEAELQEFMPDIVLGADVIYDPACLPHLVRVLATLLKQRQVTTQTRTSNCQEDIVNEGRAEEAENDEQAYVESTKTPVGYIACVIRNIDTFNCFLDLAEHADLTIRDITDTARPLKLLPYMSSYNPSCIRLFTVTSNC
ncbi:unnamed protein product [Linum trigynum]|uniref:FAM86 N-terminal domain-containing protein n=2 Tax=Linum trigynum TaxID=586398 RepID=A0AAV2GC40_9ROSI